MFPDVEEVEVILVIVLKIFNPYDVCPDWDPLILSEMVLSSKSVPETVKLLLLTAIKTYRVVVILQSLVS